MPLKKSHTFFFLFCILIYFPIFLHLDSLPLDNFDEARLAVSALEMHDHGNWLIPHFGGKPDMYSTKPPLMIWCQVLCMKVLGVNELATRLPSALAALFTIGLLFWFSKKHLKSRLTGYLAALILISTKGFIVKHVSRTGDYDALLVLFMTAQVLFFWLFLDAKEDKKRGRYIFLFGLSVALAVLTKSVVGLMFLPGMALYVLWQKKARPVLSYSKTWIALLGAIALILGYYLLREHYNPGYLQAVYENELGGRYLNALEGHDAPFLWYVKRLVTIQFVPWVYLLAIGLFVLGFKNRFRINLKAGFSVFTALVLISFFLFISIAKTKLDHYDAPIYPLLALLLAILIVTIKKSLESTVMERTGTWGMILIFGLLFSWSYYSIIDSIYLKKPHRKSNEYAWFMERNSNVKSYFVAVKNYNAHLEFYQQLYNRQGYDIQKTYPKNLVVGDTAMFCQGDVKKMIDGVYEYEILNQNRGCYLVRIEAVRSK